MPTRHRVKTSETFYRPLAVKSEAVGAHAAQTMPPVLLDAGSEGNAADSPQLIDESERLFTAAALYEAAVAGSPPANASKSGQRPRAVHSGPGSVPLWGSGTSGVPRRGSRSVRLFNSEPSALIDHVLLGTTRNGPLVLDRGTAVLQAEDLTVLGELAGAFFLEFRRVRVSLRVCRFNTMFSIAEVKLLSRRHPHRFFQAAHRAIDQVCCN